jgi:signal transduction histidine kinase
MRMVLSLVEQMDGELTAHPSPKGACFVITVPHATRVLPIS